MDNIQLREKLKCAKIFMRLTDEEIDMILNQNIGNVQNFPKGEIMIHAGQKLTKIGIILSGTVEVARLFQDGRQSQVHVLRENSVIGLDAVNKNESFSVYQYRTKTDLDIFSVPIHVILDENVISDKIKMKIMNNIIGILSHENTRQHLKLDIVSAISLRERIWRYLQWQMYKNKSDQFQIKYNREELAEYLGVNRSALSRELSKMKQEKLIDYNRNVFKIKVKN